MFGACETTLDDAKTLADIIESIVTAGGIVVAGVWTYRLFIQKRQRFPRAAVSHQTNHFRLPDGRTLLRVAAKIVNSSEVLLPIRFARTRVQQLIPLPADIAQLASEAGDPVPPGEHELPWAVLSSREWNFDEGQAEVEPGEGEVLHCDFILPAEVEQIVLYTYVSNQAKREREIGWSNTVVVSLIEGRTTS